MSSITTLSYQFHNTIAIFAAATLVIWMAFSVGRLVRGNYYEVTCLWCTMTWIGVEWLDVEWPYFIYYYFIVFYLFCIFLLICLFIYFLYLLNTYDYHYEYAYMHVQLSGFVHRIYPRNWLPSEAWEACCGLLLTSPRTLTLTP
jgi:hypothetical protein